MIYLNNYLILCTMNDIVTNIIYNATDTILNDLTIFLKF